jgi:hypothetical protein
MTDAREAFQRQIEETPGSSTCSQAQNGLPASRISQPAEGLAVTLKKAGLPHVALYECGIPSLPG